MVEWLHMHKVRLLLKEQITHNTYRYITHKPSSYHFIPGQATEVAIDQAEWSNQKRPFTFTSLNTDEVLEFTIKSYDPSEHLDHDGMTHHLKSLKPGEHLLVGDPFGTIEYKGPGVFIAAGAGLTPFLAIFKQLVEDKEINQQQLIYSNKTHKDIIREQFLEAIFEPQNLTLTLTQERREGYNHGRINMEMLKEAINKPAYVCGPPPFVKSIRQMLEDLGASPEYVVFEK